MKGGKSDLYLQQHGTERSPNLCDPSRPKLNPFHKQTLSLLGDQAWVRDGGWKTVIQVTPGVEGEAGERTLHGSP